MSLVKQTELSGKRAIILGANGYLGRHLVHYLLEAGCDVLACDAQEASAIPDTKYARVDVTNPQTLAALDWNVDHVFVFAGITGTHAGFQQFERFVQVNEIGLLNVLAAVLQSGHRPRLVFPSTRLVYAGSDVPQVETAAKQPKTLYAVNKLACEHILQSYWQAFDVPFTVFRICVPYGNSAGSGYSYGLTGAFIKQARDNGAITLFGDGSPRRTLTHVEDICRDILGVIDVPHSAGEIYNIPGEAFSLREVAELIGARYRAELRYKEWPDSDLRIESGHTVFDGSKLAAIHPRQPLHRFEQWIRQAPDL